MLMASQETVQLLALEFPAAVSQLHVPALDGDSVHLWHASRAGRQEWFQHLSSLLSSDETGRRERFRFEDDRCDFAFARGMLRSVLSAYLQQDARALRFEYSEHGKPALASVETGLQFNLSHTQGAVLLGICRERAIGVDVERVREDFNPQEIARRFFSAAEQRALSDLPEAEQRQAFFRCWTRKEAFLKARGHGLSFPLNQFDVSIGDDRVEVTLITRPHPEEAQGWQILQAPAPSGCAAAVAIGDSPRAELKGGANRWS